MFISAFNAAPYIAEAIEGLLAQTWPRFELLVIDDGSIDVTAEIAAQYATDARVRLLDNGSNQGQVVTRAQCLVPFDRSMIIVDWSGVPRMGGGNCYGRLDGARTGH